MHASSLQPRPRTTREFVPKHVDKRTQRRRDLQRAQERQAKRLH